MPELDAEHRDQMALTLFDLGLDTSEDWWNRQADVLAPLVAGWLADAWADGYNTAVVKGSEAAAGAGEAHA